MQSITVAILGLSGQYRATLNNLAILGSTESHQYGYCRYYNWVQSHHWPIYSETLCYFCFFHHNFVNVVTLWNLNSDFQDQALMAKYLTIFKACKRCFFSWVPKWLKCIFWRKTAADIFVGQPFLNYADCAIIASLIHSLCLDCKYFSFVALSRVA